MIDIHGNQEISNMQTTLKICKSLIFFVNKIIQIIERSTKYTNNLNKSDAF